MMEEAEGEMAADSVKPDTISTLHGCVEGVPEQNSACVALAMDESPPVHSLLICPAQWSAFLESTPVSIVRPAEGQVTGAGDGDRTPRETVGERCCSEEGDSNVQEQESQEVRLVLVSEPNNPPYRPSRNHSILATDHTPLATDHTHLAADHTSISMEDELEGESVCSWTYTPVTRASYQTHSRNVSDTSAYTPGSGRAAHQTHSRNVSETPSLPPFYYSSSTSSAYHSRNSSLGSQLSSCCFESDSMLSQLTDMDSCLALHTAGSHGDLKQPIRLQDSKRLGDSSPTSYSSDLSLHCHMTKPIRLQDSLLGISPKFEETLRMNRNLLEPLVEKRKLLSVKSSEWIKREVDRNLVQVKISSKSKHVVHFNVKAGDCIIWEFATKKRDIAFGVSFEATEVATEQAPLPSSHESIEKKVMSLLPTFRVGSHAHPTIGSHTATHDGIYEILWDNTYSRFFAKELYYRISTQPSVPNINYLEQ